MLRRLFKGAMVGTIGITMGRRMKVVGRVNTARQGATLLRLTQQYAASLSRGWVLVAAGEMERIDCPVWQLVRHFRRSGHTIIVAYGDGRFGDRTQR